MSLTSPAPSVASGGLPTGSSAISPTSEDSNMSNENSSGYNDTCLQLALEGEKLCKAGNCRDGVAFFEAALQAGTDDFRTLSAIYSQLGNAYFYMGDYVKAMQYHKHDLTLARTMADRLGEAKASGNLGNTLKVMGKFEEAVICCRRHLEICQEHRDRVGEGRALYNLGNVYHAKVKIIPRLSFYSSVNIEVLFCAIYKLHSYKCCVGKTYWSFGSPRPWRISGRGESII